MGPFKLNGKLEKFAGSVGGFQQSQFLKVDEGNKKLRGLFLLALHHVPHQKNNFAQFKFVWLVFVGMGQGKKGRFELLGLYETPVNSG